jgi:AraC family transcriptional regulator of adaptative response / DNA-3-methyladenine glycosylase II
VELDRDACYRALRARDRRFDGAFFVAVSTTGIYCRPICPARVPGRDRCAFFARAAEAERAGYRACFRCRPELAPGLARVDAIPSLVRRATLALDEGSLDGDSVDVLAARLGVSARHLRRAMEAELGVSPIEYAQTRRLALAKRLLQDSSLPITEIAFAAGFGSVRRFNALFSARFRRPPSDVRRRAPTTSSAGDTIAIRLDFRPPIAWSALLAFLRERAIPGVERVDGATYLRTVRLGERTGSLAVSPKGAGAPSLVASVSLSLAPELTIVIARLRALFDLDAQPHVIAEHLRGDPRLAPLVRRAPGLRLPGAFDPFEVAVRAVLGQQISVKGATTLAGRLAGAFGRTTVAPWGPARFFPTAAELAAAPVAALRALGLPEARARTIVDLARAVVQGAIDLSGSAEPAATLAGLLGLRGIGPWTAHYVAMRALGWPDAFVAGDLGVRRALGLSSARAAEARAEPWRPWRAYAVMHLWGTLGGMERG